MALVCNAKAQANLPQNIFTLFFYDETYEKSLKTSLKYDFILLAWNENEKHFCL